MDFYLWCLEILHCHNVNRISVYLSKLHGLSGFPEYCDLILLCSVIFLLSLVVLRSLDHRMLFRVR